ncbi:MAG: hypothetical protein GC152_14575 [Alphaproteobacteria bacterium]|nr:hypothetical protein [Alphaproteobacteria bacterium]
MERLSAKTLAAALLAGGLALFATVSLAQDSGTIRFRPTDQIVQDRTGAPPRRNAPALWRVSRNEGTNVYLFGTLHVLPEGVAWRTPVYDAAMADAEVTAIETDSESPAAQERLQALVQRYGVRKKGLLSDLLGPERWRAFEDRARAVGVDPDGLQRAEPWLAILSVTMAAFEKEGFGGGEGVDDAVLDQARLEADVIAFLEPVDAQIKAMASLDADGDLASFDASLEELTNFRQQTETMLTAWSSGDLEGLEAVALTDLRRIAPAAYEALFVDRNAAWLGKIDAYLGGDQDVFVAVGAGHLVGPDGLVAKLKARGVSVERLQ